MTLTIFITAWLGFGLGTCVGLRFSRGKLNIIAYTFLILLGFITFLALFFEPIGDLIEKTGQAIVEIFTFEF